MCKRLKKYYGRDNCLGYHSKSEVSADVTSMAEICKRFFTDQEIPNNLTEKQFQYCDDESVDESGRIITKEVLTNEALTLIPITPNLDYIERSDADSLSETYSEATDRARAYVRGKELETAANLEASEKATLDALKSKYESSPTSAVVSPVSDAPGQ